MTIDTYVEQVGYHVSAFDAKVTTVISEFAADICMADRDFQDLCQQLSNEQSMKLAEICVL